MASGAGPYTLVYLRSSVHMNEGSDVYLELHARVWEVYVNRDWTASPYSIALPESIRTKQRRSPCAHSARDRILHPRRTKVGTFVPRYQIVP
jgi:hypothetical protein